MTPKEKAEELVIKMYNVDSIDYFDELSMQYKHAKQCAIIAVDEIINNFWERTNGQMFYTEYRAVEYYQEVKKEIEKL